MASSNREADDIIAVIDVAEDLGLLKQTIFKVLKRLDITPRKVRDKSRNNQFVSFVTTAEAQRVAAECLPNSPTDTPDGRIIGDLAESSGIGFFYVIQLEPEHDPGRFKVGFASNIKERLRQHRCSAPFSTVLQTWPCRRTWESAAIDCTTEGCVQIRTEVFRADSLEAVLRRGGSFFGLMPNLGDDEES